MKSLLLVLAFALMFGLAGVASAQDADGDGVPDDGNDLCLGTPMGHPVDPNGCVIPSSMWIGGTSGSLDWDVAGNWSPAGVPDTAGENAIIDDTLTGDRDITTPLTATTAGVVSWIANGTFEDKLVLGDDLSIDGKHQRGWYNTSKDSTKMVMALSGNTFTTNGSWWMVPDMTIEGPGTFRFANVGGFEFASENTDDPCLWTSPVFESTVTIEGMGSMKSHGATIPNLTTIGDLRIPGGGITISGDLNINHMVTFAAGPSIIEGDVLVKAGDPNAGLFT